MIRAEITLKMPQPYRYIDTVHRAIIEGLAAAGATTPDLVGVAAKAWTFAAQGAHLPGGKSILRYLTISTADPSLSTILTKIDPAKIAVKSTSGDRIDCKGAALAFMTSDALSAQESIAINFASPFVVSQKKEARGATNHLKTIEGVDLSSAFSAGLARRLGSPIALKVKVDRLSLVTYGSKPKVVAVRQTGDRTIYFPAFQIPMTLEGSAETLAAAFFAGLGEKTRYGFGCPILPR